jgi:Holliday junction DNA helicase RuvA
MISSVRGTVLAVAGTSAVIEVGGVGLAVYVTPQHALSLRVGAEATVRTALIVREDDLSLFGFTDSETLAVFDLLRSVTGVGPKLAMAVLAAMTPDQVSRAVSLEDDAAFRKVTGVGPKTAKLIVLSLTGKLTFVAPAVAASGTGSAPARGVSDSVVIALVGLGWQEKVAIQAVDDAVATATDLEKQAVPALLRLALSNLGPQQFAGTSS